MRFGIRLRLIVLSLVMVLVSFGGADLVLSERVEAHMVPWIHRDLLLAGILAAAIAVNPLKRPPKNVMK